jgi:hypothetical protein
MPGFSLLLALALGQNPALPVQDTSPLTVQVGLFTYRADGSTAASATTGGVLGPFEGNVFANSPCAVGSSSKEPPPAARNAWRITGQVIDISSDAAVVQMEWQRSKQGGEATTGPTGSERLTLQNGTPVTLDSVWADATGSCNVVRISLEARIAPRPFIGRGSGGGVGLGGGAGVGTGGGSSRGGAGTGAGAGFTGSARIGGAGSPGADPTYDVELWLVHQPATGDERVVQAKPRFKGNWFQFSFLPLRIDTPRGVLNVEVGGALSIATGTAGEKELTFSTRRAVTYTGADGNAHVFVKAPEASGGSESKMPMPGPTEVLSFEMPPLQIPTGGPALPDRLSIRIRIRPVQ